MIDPAPRNGTLAAAAGRPRLAIEIAAFGLMVAAVFAVYWPAIHGGFLWDDDRHVTSAELRSSNGLGRIWFDLGATQQYYPLLHTLFWLEWHAWGDNPLGYHIVSILSHCLAAVLLYLVLRKLVIPGAWLAMAIFALHPVHVESVAWISEQKNTVSAVLYLSAALAYLAFDDTRKSHLWVVSFALFILAVLCKTVTASFPAAMLVILWCRRGRLSWRRDLLPLVPLLGAGIAAGIVTIWTERKLIGAEGTGFDLTIIERIIMAGAAIWFYLAKLLYPVDLSFFYPRWRLDPGVWWQWLLPLSALATSWALWRARCWCRGPLAGWLVFVGTLFPALGFFNVYPFLYSYVADHFQYLASIGPIVVAAGVLAILVGNTWRTVRYAALVGCAAMLVGLAFLSREQTDLYSHDVKTFYRLILDRNPESWLARNNLGALLLQEGRAEEAIDQFHRVIQLKPDYVEAYNNLGGALFQVGRPREAIEAYRHALDLKPNYPEAHNNLGVALVGAGEPSLAIEHFQEAVKLRPNFPSAHYNLGNALSAEGRWLEAIDQYNEAIAFERGYSRAHFRLAIALRASGRLQESLQAGETALQQARRQGRAQLAHDIEEWLRTHSAGSGDYTPP